MPMAPPPQLKAGLFSRNPGGQTKGENAPKASGPRGVAIEARIGVQAPADVIWAVVRELPTWSEWNPTYTKAEGEIRIGSALSMTLALPGQQARQINPVVVEWVPNEQLHWKLSLMGGLVKTIRYIEIEQLAEESCIVSNGEIFMGLMGSGVARQLGRSINRGFRQMNDALKARAEALHRRS